MDTRQLQVCDTIIKKIKQVEIKSIGTMPHPFEYKLYFNL